MIYGQTWSSTGNRRKRLFEYQFSIHLLRLVSPISSSMFDGYYRFLSLARVGEGGEVSARKFRESGGRRKNFKAKKRIRVYKSFFDLTYDWN